MTNIPIEQYDPHLAEEFKGSRIVEVLPGLMSSCISPEAADLLETIMHAWEEEVEKSKKILPPRAVDTQDHYRFAYWLVRWSGMIRPAVGG